MRVQAVASEGDVLRAVVSLLQDRLPPRWRATADVQQRTDAGHRVDAVVELRAPTGEAVRVVMEVKGALVTRDLPGVVEQLRHVSAAVAGPTVPLVAARYLPPPVRTWLESNGVSYADATGNIRLVAEAPAIYLRDRGADKDPWRGPGRPRGDLKGAPAWRVVRALADFTPPMPVTTLIEVADSSTGVVYRVLDFLDQEALLTRGPRGLVTEVRWRALLERWSQDYGFLQDNTVEAYLQPRGIAALLADLPALAAPGGGEGAHEDQYAVTGSLAVPAWTAPYAPAKLATVYVSDIRAAARSLGLRRVDTGANVLLATPPTNAAFARACEVDGVRYASPSQVAVDLLTGPGRNPAEGTALLDWMATDEPTWRRTLERPARRPGRGA